MEGGTIHVAAMRPAGQGQRPTRMTGGVEPPSRPMAAFDTVQLHRRDESTLVLGGISARILLRKNRKALPAEQNATAHPCQSPKQPTRHPPRAPPYRRRPQTTPWPAPAAPPALAPSTPGARDGAWTRGLHFLWWMKERRPTLPALAPVDLGLQSRAPLARQIELTTWSITMLRLTLIGDIAQHASDDPIFEARELPEEAALAASTSERRLQSWIHKRAIPLLERVLPWSRYKALPADLRSP